MKLFIFIIVLLMLVLGFIIGYRTKQEKIKSEKERLKKEEEQIKENLEELKKEEQSYIEKIQNCQQNFLKQQKEENQFLEEYKKERQQLIDSQINSEFELSREKLMKKIEEISRVENLQLEENLKENREKFEEKMKNFQVRLDAIRKELEDLQEKRNIAVAAAKREEEELLKTSFYRLQITEKDISDIIELKQIENRLSKKDVLNKLIYKVYFEKPYTDLIGRVIGKEIKSGIYKITNINNKKVYVGQAVNIAERWKQHIKRALGAETRTQNKLYPAMEKEGIWNFSFEVLEICSKDKLNEREQYWQDFFKAKEFGYSIK